MNGIRIKLVEPSAAEIHEPATGLMYHEDGKLARKVVLQIRLGNSEWLDVPMIKEEDIQK